MHSERIYSRRGLDSQCICIVRHAAFPNKSGLPLQRGISGLPLSRLGATCWRDGVSGEISREQVRSVAARCFGLAAFKAGGNSLARRCVRRDISRTSSLLPLQPGVSGLPLSRQEATCWRGGVSGKTSREQVRSVAARCFGLAAFKVEGNLLARRCVRRNISRTSSLLPLQRGISGLPLLRQEATCWRGGVEGEISREQVCSYPCSPVFRACRFQGRR
jgi:hypothetical protein